MHDTATSTQQEHHGALALYVLASGSKGNASIVEDTQTGRCVLIDCGICKRDFFERCTTLHVDPAHIESILITHEHTDHTKGLGVVLRGMSKAGIHPTLYASTKVHAASREIGALANDCPIEHFSANDDLSLAGMSIHAFPTSHDAAESFGFRFDAGADALGYMTDTGVVTPEAHEALQGCRILALESNHDVRMLKYGPYPASLKERIASDAGHLSNEQAADELESLLCNELEQVVAMHISENNNDYVLPRQVLAQALARNDHAAQACVGFQRTPVSLF